MKCAFNLRCLRCVSVSVSVSVGSNNNGNDGNGDCAPLTQQPNKVITNCQAGRQTDGRTDRRMDGQLGRVKPACLLGLPGLDCILVRLWAALASNAPQQFATLVGHTYLLPNMQCLHPPTATRLPLAKPSLGSCLPWPRPRLLRLVCRAPIRPPYMSVSVLVCCCVHVSVCHGFVSVLWLAGIR